MAGETCYWCGLPETSREHVPPRCIFPEAKDTQDGTGYRENPITVPSCDEHNMARSKDDEYLLCILAMSILNNPIGNQQATTKVLRALKRSNGLTHLVLDQNSTVVIEDTKTGKIENTIAVKVDYQRITNVLHHIVRGVYFHEYRESWPGIVKLVAEFLISMGVPEALRQNDRMEELRKIADDSFANVEKHGQYQDVFCYQLIDRLDTDGQLFMRLSFFEGTRVSAYLIRHCPTTCRT